jgi:hypothetical protein
MKPAHRGILGLFVGLWLAGCDPASVQVEFYAVDGQELAWWEQATVGLLAEAAAREARTRLPQLPQALVLRVQPGTSVEVDEGSGDTTATLDSNTIMWTVDPTHRGGVFGVAVRELRVSLFHAWHHMVRDASVAQRNMLDRAVREGLALAFERDCAHTLNPRSRYTAEAALWVDELRGAPDDLTIDEWTEQYADGRRFVVARAGAYLVDRALKASGKSASQLATTPTAAILALARAD